MNILSQKYIDVIKNVIKKSLNCKINDIIDSFVNKYTIDNYINIIKNIDIITNDIAKQLIISTLEIIDDSFFKSDYRKRNFHSKGFKERGIYTCFGFIIYKRRIYEYKVKDDNYDNYLIYTDRYLGLPKRDRFDPYVCSLVIDMVSDNNSMIKVGKNIGNIIDKKVNINEELFYISRQQVKNIITKASKLNLEEPLIEIDTPDEIFVMADEKFVHNQREDNDKTMVKSVIVFDDMKKVSKNRKKLINKHVVSKIGDGIWEDVLNYIDYVYDEDKLKVINILGDGGKWIKQGLKELKFNNNIKVIYSSDKFHPLLALNNITKDEFERNLLKGYMIHNKKKGFKEICEALMIKYTSRKETIEDKMNYILNNWYYIQNSYYKCKFGCSMESHISHIYASIFSNRPKGYKIETLKFLVNLRSMNENEVNIKELYLDNYRFNDNIYYNSETNTHGITYGNIPSFNGKNTGLRNKFLNIIYG